MPKSQKSFHYLKKNYIYIKSVQKQIMEDWVGRFHDIKLFQKEPILSQLLSNYF